MPNKLKLLTFIFSALLLSAILTSANIVNAGTIRCKSGACNTDADCLGAANGGLAVCREDGKGYKECANAFCPYGKTIPGANCDCSAGRTCGQTCNASVGLCQDGKSTCRYIVGPNCRVSKPNGVDETTYCVPGGAPGIEVHRCVARDTFNSYALYNGNNPTLADLTYACSLVACKPSDPVAATLNTPANNSQVVLGLNNSVALNYTINGWGTACPANNNIYDVQLSSNCSGTYVSYNNAVQFTNLAKGATYCWRIVKDNGSGIKVVSSANRFTTIDDRVTVVTAGIKADVCGNGFSGVAGSPLVSNPVDYGFTFTTPATNTYKEVWLAMVPDNTAYNTNCSAFKGPTVTTISNNVCQNMESADTQTEAVILQKAKNSNGAVFKIILDSAGNPIEARAFNGVGWNSITNAGNVSGLGATLMDFKNGGSTSIVQNTNLVDNFRIRLDSTPLGKFAFYVSTIITDPLGNTKSSYSTPTSTFVYKRTNATTTLTNWGVDLNPPASTGAFSTVKYSPNGQFNITWSLNEANTLQLKSFITRDSTDSVLKDLAAGDINFNNGALPDVNSFNNGTLDYASINNQNGYVTQSSTTPRTYQGDATKQSNYQFYAYAKDIACNQKVVSTSAALQKPWVLSYNGDLSAAKGIIGLALPNGLDQLSDTLKDKNNNAILSDKQSVYLSTYGTISGTADLPLKKQSKFQQYISGYEDLTIKPPLDSGFVKWYDYIYDLVKKNSTNIVNLNASQVLSGKTSTLLGVAAGTKMHAVINGNLTVTASTVCDTQSIFFVIGNPNTKLDPVFTNATIKFDPNFTNSSNSNGCIFVTLGDILIDNGDKSSSGLSLDNPQLANYDVVEAALITDGQFITKKDIGVNTEKGDGLIIKGSVVSENVYLQRDINLNANQSQPSQIFYFDPRYREIFKNDLNYNKYSIREVGYTN